MTDHAAKRLLEFFAGIGLIHEGLRGTGWECAYANDLDRHKRQLYEGHFGAADYWHLADIWETDQVLSRIVGEPFLATASFPCTDMSLAGNREGFAGPESSAFFGFTAVLERLGERRPPLVMLENVVGLLTAHQGADFRAAAQHLAALGYWLDAFCLDARHFVPQSRPRLFLVGMRDPPTAASGLDASSLAPSELRPKRLLELMRSTVLPTGWHLHALPEPPLLRKTLAEVIDVDDGQRWWDEDQVARHRAMLSDLHRGKLEAWRERGGAEVATAFRRIRKGQQRLEVRFDGLAGCLRTPKGGSARQIIVAWDPRRGLRMRWMSPREYARLQGADDFRWSPETAESRVLFGFGDAVCVPVIGWIDQHLLTPLWEAAQLRFQMG